jgi:hypothetical protein
VNTPPISAGEPEAKKEAIRKAARRVRAIAVYLILVGAFGLFVLEWSGVLALLVGASVLGCAFLIERFQSRAAASVLLAAALAALVTGLLGWRDVAVTGLVLRAVWVLAAALAVLATIRYHRAAGSAERA